MKAKEIFATSATNSSWRVFEVDPQTDERWEILLKDIPTGWMYYHPAWLKIEEEGYGYKSAHLACEDTSNGQMIGILPLFYRRGLRSGRSLRSGFIGSSSH